MTFGILPNVNQFFQSETGCTFGNKCSFPHREVEEQSNKKPKKDGDKNAVAIVEEVRQLGCVLQDTEPPQSEVLGPIRRVRFTKATQLHGDIREIKRSIVE